MRVYKGQSQLNHSEIQVVLTGLDDKSDNAKTGDMVHAWIMPLRVVPHVAVRTGSDESVCGECPLRPSKIKEHNLANKGPAKKPCYVVKVHGPRATYQKHKGAAVELPTAITKPLRLGAWGDPAAAPIALWRYLTKLAPSWTGYTHQWAKRKHVALKQYCMASVDSPAQARQAQRLGWRTFRTKHPHEPLLANEITCPASAEAGKRSTCAKCGLCDGKTGPADRRKNIAINYH
jgi:hypothetical protein